MTDKTIHTKDAGPLAPCALSTDDMLMLLRKYANLVRVGDEGRVQDMAVIFLELDDRLLAAGQLPKEWQTD